MRVLDVLSDTPWAIMPGKKLEIDSIYLAHTRREKVDFEAIEKKIGMPLSNQPKGYEIVNGVAILPIEGVIAKRMSLFTKISGGVSTSLIQNDFRQAMNDSAVKAIILQIDSPGGAVDGTQELANLIHQSRGTKPIVAYADGLMASAACWIGLAADSVFAASETTWVGSIGVVATHVDVSKAEEQAGYKTTEITAGTFKRIASEHAPLTPEGRASIQDQVDGIYRVFISDVAKFRGMDSIEEVHERMADGRLFMGAKAVEAGLVDGISTLSDLIDTLSAGEDPTIHTIRKKSATVHRDEAGVFNAEDGASSDPQNLTTKGNIMDKDTLKAEHPELFEAIHAEGFAAGAAEASEKELARVKAIFEVGAKLPGHDALVREMAFDGKTNRTEAMERIVDAEAAKKATVAANLKADAPKPAPPSTGEEAKTVSDDAPIEERAKAEWDKDPKVRAEFGGKFDAFLAFKTNEEAGRARVFKK